MLNRSASLAMSTSVLKALPGKLDIKRHSPSILYVYILMVPWIDVWSSWSHLFSFMSIHAKLHQLRIVTCI